MKKIFLSITFIVAAIALSACTEDTPEARDNKRSEIGHRLAGINALGSNHFYMTNTDGCTVKELEQIGKAFEDGHMYTHEIDQDLFYKLLYIDLDNMRYFTNSPNYRGTR